MGYEVIRGGQGYSTAFPEKGDVIIRRIGGGGKSKSGSRTVTPTVSLGKVGEVFINGQGYSVAPSLLETFIKSKGGVVTSTIQQQIIAQKKAQEEAQKRIAFLKTQAQQEAQRKLQRVLTTRITQEKKLKQDISKLEQQRRASATQSISKENYNKILAEKKDKEKELYELRSGVTAYNKKVDLLVMKAQKELDDYINKEFNKLQTQVNSGSISVESANKILNDKVNNKTSEINKILNDKIQKINPPGALQIPIKSVEAVELDTKKKITIGGRKIYEGYKEKILPEFLKGEEAKKYIKGLEDIGIGISSSIYSMIEGGIQTANIGRKIKINYPKLIASLVKEPTLINTVPKKIIQTINTLPVSKLIKQQGEIIGTSLKISPTLTLAKIGTEIYFLIGGGSYFKDVKTISRTEKLSSLSKLEKSGKLSRIAIKLISGKNPKIQMKIGGIIESIKPFSSTKNINSIFKDLTKGILKVIPKTKLKEVEKGIEKIINNYLRNENVIKELIRRYPGKKSFKFNEIKRLNSYPKLKAIIKRDVFDRYGIKIPRNYVYTQKRFSFKQKQAIEIGGVKVSKKEFKTYQEAINELNKFKKGVGKFVRKIENKGGAGQIENLPKRPITKSELEYFEIGRKIPRELLKDIGKISTTTFIQKFVAEVPIIKRFGSLKKGYWKMILKDIEFYQNSVSFSLFKKSGKPVGTITFNTLSSKPLTRFRSLTNALKWGRNKNIIFSKLVGKDFVRSFILKARGVNKITPKEFLSKIKITPQGNMQEIIITTKQIPRYTNRINLKKQFKEAIPVSLTKGKIRKSFQTGMTKINLKKGFFEIVQRGRIIKRITTKSIINPVIIDTSKIDNVIRELNSLKINMFSNTRIKRIKQIKQFLKNSKKTKSFSLEGREKLIIPEKRLKQINKISQEIKILKESTAGSSIPPRLKIKTRIKGIKELRKLKKAENEIKRLRLSLIKKGALDIASKTAILQALKLINKFKQDLKKGQLIVNTQITRSIQSSIQRSLQKTKSKQVLKTIKILKDIYPLLVFDIRTRDIKPRSVKIKIPPIPIPKKTLLKDFKILSKPTKIYNVVVKKRGKNIILKDKLTEKDALNFMAYELDTTLLRSSVLKPIGNSKIVRRISSKYDSAYNKRKQKLRQYKIKQKRKIAIKGFIEKKKYSLDTSTEKRQLALLRKRPIRRNITTTQRRILLQRLKKARAVRMRKLRRK